MDVTGRREQIGHLAASRCDVHPLILHNFVMINPIQKDQLAKLLAMEDIHVRHSGDASTASFDVQNRVLTLPVWADMTADIIDMLTGLEVGHALYTLP